MGIRPGDPGVKDDGYDSGIGRGTVRSWIAPFASFKIGEEEIRKTRLRFFDMGDLDYDMLVGADFFLAHRVYVANGRHRLYLTYDGGPVFQLDRPAVRPGLDGATAAAPAAAPTSATATVGAADLARRGPRTAIPASVARPATSAGARPGRPTTGA